MLLYWNSVSEQFYLCCSVQHTFDKTYLLYLLVYDAFYVLFLSLFYCFDLSKIKS